MDWVFTADTLILDWIQNNLQCGFLDFLMPLVTALGNLGAVWIAAAIPLICIKKYRRYGIVLLAVLAFSALLGNFVIKPLVMRPRPCHIDESFLLLINTPHDSSFPSCHTLTSVACAAVLTMTDRRFALAAVPVAFFIAFSRLYLFVHFPSDVLAGGIIGFLVGFAAMLIFCRRPVGDADKRKAG